MKTEEQYLLNYMYLKGYTDEDMFDKSTMNKVQGSIGFIVYKFRLVGFPKIVAAFKFLAEKVIAAWNSIPEKVQSLMPEFKFLAMDEPQLPQLKAFSPIDFSKRPRIRHQVINRKPNHLVRKIIR